MKTFAAFHDRSTLDLPIHEVLARAVEGESLTPGDGYRLIRSSASELPALMLAASQLRDRGKGQTVTYSRKVFIPLTNLCRDKCGYCTFAKAPNHPEAHTMTPDEVLAVARAGQAQGCKEALFSLGEKPEELHARARADLRRLGYSSTVSYLAAMCDLVYRETGLLPHANCGVLTRDELIELREVNASMGLMLESISERLLQRGQAHYGCPGKAPALRLETMETAGELGIAFTTGILIGIGETLEERVDSLFAIRDLQARCGNIQEVIIQNFRVKFDIRMRDHREPSPLDMLRTIAVARLILGPDQNVQAPPNLAPDIYQMYLFAGINDWGGISPVTKDHINPERAWPMIQELYTVTAEAGFALRERLCIYAEYLARPEFVRDRFRDRIASLVDEQGIVRQEETRW
ncbi:MAG TPA: 7,8-didemethyl-8-hydroxy-5-deazariboflavin synthase CofG [Chloroflexota bacterium]|nr:7,8-didemethyl-8-hydroxy-5-deazariboflavin synthase CofG [Chloroflexota bacterium]